MKTISRANLKREHSSPIIYLVLVAVVLAACSDNKKQPDAPSQGKVVIKGSNTIGEELGPRLIAEYKKEHPGIAFDLESKGTGSGFAALFNGQCNIAAASRVVNYDELAQANSNHVDLNCYMIGSYAVAVVVNTNNSVSNLTRDQVRDIFTGSVKNWKDVGGSDAPIKLHARDPISGTYLGFRELFMENKPYASNVTTSTNYEGIVEAISKDAAGVGYATIYLTSKPGVKAVSIRGVAPDVLAVSESRYPFSRVLRLYTDKSKEDPATRHFIQFVQSNRGQEILTELGYVPRP